MASQDPLQSPTAVDSNAMIRRPVPVTNDVDSGITAINSPVHTVGGPPYVSQTPIGPVGKHVAVSLPPEDERTQPYDRRGDPPLDERAGPNTPYWERRRWERERERARDSASWRAHPDFRNTDTFPEFLPYAGGDRHGGPPSDIGPLKSPDPHYARTSVPAGPPRIPPSYGRYDDGIYPSSGPIGPYRKHGWDEEAQYEDYMTWKYGRGRGRGSSRDRSRTRTRSRANTNGHRRHRDDTDSSTEIAMRIPYLNWMGWTAKGHLVAFLGEFVGTTMFLFFAFSGTQVANVDSRADTNSTTGAATGFNATVLLYIALVFGFSLMVNVWVFYRISGGLFNPAVTLAMLLVKSVTAFRALLLLIAQLLGAIFASFLVKTIFPTNFNVRTTLSPTTSLTRGVFIEAILTAELIFAIFMLAKEKHKATFIAPVGIGLALFIAELVGVYYTGGSLNPARSFGPCVVSKTFDREHWIYWVGPGAGAIVAVVFYKFILVMQYELANPGQDESSEEKAAEAAEEAKAKVDELEENR